MIGQLLLYIRMEWPSHVSLAETAVWSMDQSPVSFQTSASTPLAVLQYGNFLLLYGRGIIIIPVIIAIFSTIYYYITTIIAAILIFIFI